MARKQVHTWRRGDFGRRWRAHVGGRLAPHVALLSPLPYMRVLASHLRTARVSDAQLQSSLSNIAAAHLSAVHHKGDVGGSTRITTTATNINATPPPPATTTAAATARTVQGGTHLLAGWGLLRRGRQWVLHSPRRPDRNAASLWDRLNHPALHTTKLNQ